MNKVLNRPMFRQQALRKGHLKPIHAQTGVMVGPPGPTITGVANPNKLPSTVVKPQGFFKKLGTEFRTSRQGIQQIMNPKSPQFSAKGTLGSGRLIPGLLGVEGIASVVDPYVGQYIENPLARSLVTYGISGAAALNPYVRAAGLAKFGYDIADNYAFKPIAAGIKKYRETPMSERRALPNISGEADMDLIEQTMGRAQVKNEQDVKTALQNKKAKPGSQRIGFGGRDRLTEDDNKSEVVQGDVDISKVVANNVDPNLKAPLIGAKKTTIQDNMPPKEDKTMLAQKNDNEDVKTEEDANKQLVKTQEANTAEGKVKAGDGTSVTNETIALAKEYRKELMAGQKSQAKLVFLANLASGLLTGKTTQGGLGGALEVFGAALGPAINNYATIKLKENELENDFMSDALTLAKDEIDARNGVLEAPDFPDAVPGIIQLTDDSGTRNVTARRLKDGTVQYAVYGQKDQYGRQLFITAPYGSYDKFLKQDFAAKEQTDTLRDLSAKYKAYSLGRDSIDILKKEDVVGGPKGRLNIFTKRLGDAMNDFGMGFFGQEDGMAKIAEMREDVKQGLISGGKSKEEAEKYLNEKFGKGNSLFKKTLKEMGVFKDTGADLERLAINETILTYALANSLKSKDRLTEKDIKMAQNLVNVFPMLRGEKSVIQSLEAVNETILKDIERLEFDYTNAYLGDSITISNYRRRYNIVGSEGQALQGDLPGFFDNMSTEDVLGNIQID